MSNLSDVSEVTKSTSASHVSGVVHHSGVAVPPAPKVPVRSVKRKTRITIYLDDEVLQAFRNRSEESGKGYQTLINAALRTGLGGAAKVAHAD